MCMESFCMLNLFGQDCLLKLCEIFKVSIHVRGNDHVHYGLPQWAVVFSWETAEDVDPLVAECYLERKSRMMIFQHGTEVEKICRKVFKCDDANLTRRCKALLECVWCLWGRHCLSQDGQHHEPRLPGEPPPRPRAPIHSEAIFYLLHAVVKV